ncbi:MAG: 2TM domain-containing protein [Thermoleophilia bacterium]|nr:2TM domain-containing protein [Thermoleophilia bacterium]
MITVCIELTKSGTSESTEGGGGEDELRALARRNVSRVRDFRLHLLAFVVGTTILAATWALTEYLEADGWPKRFGDGDASGTWHIWIFYVVGVWAVFVALKGVGAYGRRRPREMEIERELERMTSRG